jgi:hypothetical protein
MLKTFSLLVLSALALTPSVSVAQPDCKKGIPCGNSCISASKVCRIGSPTTPTNPSTSPTAPRSSSGTTKKSEEVGISTEVWTASSPPNAQSRWRTLREGNPSISLDTSTVLQDNEFESKGRLRYDNVTFYRVWVRIRHKTAQSEQSEGRTFSYLSAVQQLSINCTSKLYRFEKSYFYRANGTVAHANESVSTSKWSETVPDSIGEEMVSAFCTWQSSQSSHP